MVDPLDLVTFFQPRGAAFVFVFEWGSRQQILALSRADITKVKLAYDGSIDEFFLQLKNAMKTGGLIVDIDAEHSTLRVLVVSASTYEHPTQILGLDINGGTKAFNLEAGVRFEPGDHFLIPVDRSAEKILESLRHTLSYLPADQERNVFNVIRRPSLELRIRTLERAMQGFTPTGEATSDRLSSRNLHQVRTDKRYKFRLGRVLQSFGGLVGGIWDFCIRNWPVTVLGILISATTLFVWYRATVSISSAPELLAAMAKSSNPQVNVLYNAHALATLNPSAGDLVEDPRFASAVVKLELMRLHLLPDESSDLLNTYSFGDSNQIMNTQAADIEEKSTPGMLEFFCSHGLGSSPPSGCSRLSASGSSRVSSLETVDQGIQQLIYFVSSDENPAPQLKPLSSPFAIEGRNLLEALRVTTKTDLVLLFKGHRLANVTDPFNDPNFAYAVVKLELMRLQLLRGTSSDVVLPEAVRDSITILNQQPAAVQKGRSVMLGYVCCQAFKYPGLKTSTENVSIPGEGPCAPLDESKTKLIKDGFTDIVSFVLSER